MGEKGEEEKYRERNEYGAGSQSLLYGWFQIVSIGSFLFKQFFL